MYHRDPQVEGGSAGGEAEIVSPWTMIAIGYSRLRPRPV